MKIKPYCIGSNEWNGLSKLIEECGEVLQVAGKIIGNEGKINHWDGSNLRDRLESELGDLLAAINFVIDENGLHLTSIQKQCDIKTETFKKWHDANKDRQ